MTCNGDHGVDTLVPNPILDRMWEDCRTSLVRLGLEPDEVRRLIPGVNGNHAVTPARVAWIVETTPDQPEPLRFTRETLEQLERHPLGSDWQAKFLQV